MKTLLGLVSVDLCRAKFMEALYTITLPLVVVLVVMAWVLASETLCC
jgi:hypothetical protein